MIFSIQALERALQFENETTESGEISHDLQIESLTVFAEIQNYVISIYLNTWVWNGLFIYCCLSKTSKNI